MIAFKEIKEVVFPEYTGVRKNMVPVEKGNIDTFPDELKQYYQMVEETHFEDGDIVFLTVREGEITEDRRMLSRGGIHVESPNYSDELISSWGNYWGKGVTAASWGYSPRPSGWGSGNINSSSNIPEGGIFMASTDGATVMYDEIQEDRDVHGGCVATTEPVRTKPSTLYWFTDKTPHEGVESEVGIFRQFVRIVGPKLGMWLPLHMDHNPLIPDDRYPPMVMLNKFDLI